MTSLEKLRKYCLEAVSDKRTDHGDLLSPARSRRKMAFILVFYIQRYGKLLGALISWQRPLSDGVVKVGRGMSRRSTFHNVGIGRAKVLYLDCPRPSVTVL